MIPKGTRQGEAEKALLARTRLWRHYRTRVRAHRAQVFEGHPLGGRLREFYLRLQRFKPADAAAFLTYIQEQNRVWLCAAPPEVRALALGMAGDKIRRLREAAGMVPFDDPLPGEEDDMFQACRRELT